MNKIILTALFVFQTAMAFDPNSFLMSLNFNDPYQVQALLEWAIEAYPPEPPFDPNSIPSLAELRQSPVVTDFGKRGVWKKYATTTAEYTLTPQRIIVEDADGLPQITDDEQATRSITEILEYWSLDKQSKWVKYKSESTVTTKTVLYVYEPLQGDLNGDVMVDMTDWYLYARNYKGE